MTFTGCTWDSLQSGSENQLQEPEWGRCGLEETCRKKSVDLSQWQLRMNRQTGCPKW